MKKAIAFLIVAIFLFCATSLWLFKNNLDLRKSLKEIAKKQEIEVMNEINLKTGELRKDITRDSEEKYRADMVSYRVMAARLEMQNKKQKELEGKLNKQGGGK